MARGSGAEGTDRPGEARNRPRQQGTAGPRMATPNPTRSSTAVPDPPPPAADPAPPPPAADRETGASVRALCGWNRPPYRCAYCVRQEPEAAEQRGAVDASSPLLSLSDRLALCRSARGLESVLEGALVPGPTPEEERPKREADDAEAADYEPHDNGSRDSGSDLDSDDASDLDSDGRPRRRRHRRAATVELPPVYRPSRYEFAWLSCQSPQRRKWRASPATAAPGSASSSGNGNGKSDTVAAAPPLATASLLGLLEEERELLPDGSSVELPVAVHHWRACAADTAAKAPPCSASYVCTCPPHPRLDWCRNRPSYLPPEMVEGDDRDGGEPSQGWQIHVVDLREAPQWRELEPTAKEAAATHHPAHAFHLLTSLLSPLNTHSPWTSASFLSRPRSSSEEFPPHNGCGADVVLLLLPNTAAQLVDVLLRFRVSDACPAWYLHSVLTVADPSVPHSVSASAPARCFSYRRLPPRASLSSRHWDDSQASPPLPPGCLWERYRLPEDEPDGLPSDGGDGDPPQYAVRCVAPPFFDARSAFPELQGILDRLDVVRAEAMAIAHWTAWPEQQHYSAPASSPDGMGEGAAVVPWTVFPLCYCFPANEPDRLTWVERTSAHVPATVLLLKECLGPRLRTALFSRLAPNATLQAHTGWQDLANHVLRLHIPLVVPPSTEQVKIEGKGDNDDGGNSLCGLWVDGCVEPLRRGEIACFDDSKLHWAYNYHPQFERIVLLVDLARPSHFPVGTATGGHTEELDAFIRQYDDGDRP